MTTSSTTFRIPNFFPFPKISNHNNNLINPIIFCNHKYKYKYSSVSNLNPSIILKFNNSNNNNNNKKHSLSVSCFMAVGTTATTAKVAGDRLQRLVSEFESLTEPIDRVKRLLDYAARLPPFDESARVPGNRVVGCTTQVWLEARMDENGRMRFRADSDSEITKGFISCLIWLLDGADPDEVVAVKAEDLTAMNVGLYGKAQSRVNTWHNVLISMQNRTAALAAERKENLPITEPLSEASFVQAQACKEVRVGSRVGIGQHAKAIINLSYKFLASGMEDHRCTVHDLSVDEVLGKTKDISSDTYLVAILKF